MRACVFLTISAIFYLLDEDFKGVSLVPPDYAQVLNFKSTVKYFSPYYLKATMAVTG